MAKVKSSKSKKLSKSQKDLPLIKIIIVTGFLGCGKTQLVGQFISQNSDKKIVIIENEVAGLGVDGKISNSHTVEIVEINDGSISNVNLDNFRRVLKKVIPTNPDILIIETSGASNLNPVLAVLKDFRNIVPYVISIIDSERFSSANKLSSHTLGHVDRASVVILNKCDLISVKEKNKQLKNLNLLNHHVIPTTKCKVDTLKILKGIKPVYISDLKVPKSKSYLAWEIQKHWKFLRNKKEKHQNINAFVYETYGVVDEEKLKSFFKNSKIPRAKGFITLKDGETYFFSVVNTHFELEKAPIPQTNKFNQIVLIGDSIYADRNILRPKLRKIVKKSVSNHVSDFGWYLAHQQNAPKQVVYLK